MQRREVGAMVLMAGFFVLIQSLALAAIGPFVKAGMPPAFENPSDPLNLVYFFVIILTMTAIILLVAKFWKKQVIQAIILFAVGYTSFYVLDPLLFLLVGEPFAVIASALLAVCLVVVLWRFPEWYVVDCCGVVVGAGAIAIFGMSLDIALVVVLLICLAVYDAISVYRTKHMVDLADTVMDLKLPVLLVIPKVRGYSLFEEESSIKEKVESGQEREAFFMGLGDIVMPGILTAAVFFSVGSLALSACVLLGTLIGFVILMSFVLKGNPQAGLPLLCGGAIVGYVLGSFVLFGKLVGFSLAAFGL